MNMIRNGQYYSKEEWRKIVWQTLWKLEDDHCDFIYKQPKPDTILCGINGNTYYLVWWLISDIMPERMAMCESLASIVCDMSLLKMTDYRIKQKTIGFKMCNRCSPERAPLKKVLGGQ